MKIVFIAPAWDLVREKAGARVFLLAPLTFPVLAALTCEEIEIDIIEERLRPIPFDAHYDLVGLTFVTSFAPCAYAIADVVSDIERMDDETWLLGDYLVSWDDNISGDLNYPSGLCSAIAPFKKKMAGRRIHKYRR
jgi:hypothetical protein